MVQITLKSQPNPNPRRRLPHPPLTTPLLLRRLPLSSLDLDSRLLPSYKPLSTVFYNKYPQLGHLSSHRYNAFCDQIEEMEASRRLVAFLFVFYLALCAAPGADAARAIRRRCDEVYVAKEGETLQTISVKCDAPFILDDNPQISDTDDIGPGTVLFIRPWPYGWASAVEN